MSDTPRIRQIPFLLAVWVGLSVTLSLGDHFFHVRTGILRYHWSPFVDSQSAWTWLIFSVAAAAMVGTSVLFPLSDVPDTVPWTAIVDSALLFVGAYALSGQLGATHPTLLFWSFVIAWLVRIAIKGRDLPVYFVHGLVLATCGVVAEGLFSMAGLFDYRLQQVIRCPWWLAGLYLHGSVALLQVARGARSLRR